MLTIEDIRALGQVGAVAQAVIDAVAQHERKIAQASAAEKESAIEDAVIWLESLRVDYWESENQAYLQKWIDHWKATLIPGAYPEKPPVPELEPEPEPAKPPWMIEMERQLLFPIKAAVPVVKPAVPVAPTPAVLEPPTMKPRPVTMAPVRIRYSQLQRILPTAIGLGALGIGGVILWLVLRRK